ncbi:M23 family metallopeptidase [Streptomyces sp. PLAI1-29]|uniref:M23 family metallopeptidase n=2 Tax=Streptomyces zingiberis TaxID=2053010 RepID=A0ABX1C4X7_9ACTN|nr:M23 family metallopeptidase [Streptomyces zingiberis]
MAAGAGATAALGTGVALGTQGGADIAPQTTATQVAESTTGVSALKAQAGAQQKAAGATATAQKAAAKPAATPASWVKPVDSYTKGPGFGLGGDRWSHKHSGQDFAAPTGTSVKSAHGGTVVQAGWGGSYGNNIVVKHGDGVFTQYGHLSKITVPAGTQVKTGQEIGKVGSTGNSTGPHLHFETRTTPNYGSGVNPVAFMAQRGVQL